MSYNSLGGDPPGGYQASGMPMQAAYNPDFAGNGMGSAGAYGGAYGGAYTGVPQQQQQLQPPQVRLFPSGESNKKG